MEKSTIIGIFVLASYVLIFHELFGSPQTARDSAAAIVLMNAIALYLTWFNPILLTRKSILEVLTAPIQRNAEISKSMKAIEVLEHRRMLMNVLNSVVLAVITVIVLTAATLMVNSTIIPIQNIEMVVFSYMMMAFLLIRMRVAHEQEIQKHSDF